MWANTGVTPVQKCLRPVRLAHVTCVSYGMHGNSTGLAAQDAHANMSFVCRKPVSSILSLLSWHKTLR